MAGGLTAEIAPLPQVLAVRGSVADINDVTIVNSIAMPIPVRNDTRGMTVLSLTSSFLADVRFVAWQPASVRESTVKKA